MLALAGGILLLDAQAGDVVGPLSPDDRESADPFPIRRILATNNQIVADLQSGKQGEWRRLPRQEFETLVRDAARGGREGLTPARLLKASYRARLSRDSLDDHALEGTAEWKLANTNKGPALLPLDSLGVAVRLARWTDNRPALYGLFEPRTPASLALLMEEKGEHALALEWSMRGVPANGTVRFDLAFPSSPIAALELEIPTDLVPVVSTDEAFVEGPFPIENEERRQLWRIAFGGLSRLELSVRPASAEAQRVPLLTNLSSRFEVAPGTVSSQFTFEFQALRGDVTLLVVEHDEELAPTEVNVLNLDSWRPVDGAASGKKRLEIRLREPTQGGHLRIAARSALVPKEGAYWTTPAMSIVGAINRTEQMRLRVPPEMKMVDWRDGAFRLIRVDHAAGGSTLAFEPELVPEGQNPMTRPAVRFQIGGSEYRTREQLSWQLTNGKSHLTSRVEIDVQRGTLHQISFRMPPGADVEKVELEPQDLNRAWTIQGGGNPILQIETARPIAAGNEARAIIQAKLPDAGMTGSRTTRAFPDLIPIGARQRGGEFHLRVDSTLEAQAPPSTADDDIVGPIAPDPRADGPQWSYRFHGQAPSGPVTLAKRPGGLSAVVEQSVRIEGIRVHGSARIALHPEAGAVQEVVFHLTGPIAQPVSSRVVEGGNQIVSVESRTIDGVARALGAIGSRQALGTIGRLLHSARGQWLHIRFAHPQTSPIVLELQWQSANQQLDRDTAHRLIQTFADLGMNEAERSIQAVEILQDGLSDFLQTAELSVPLIHVDGASRQQRMVNVRIPTSASRRIAASGVVRSSERRDLFGTESIFRITDNRASIVIGPEGSAIRTPTFQAESARLFVVADRARDFHCWYSVRVRCTDGAETFVRLPRGSRVEAVAVAGRLLRPEQIHCESENDATKCSFAIPDDHWHTLELLYASPTPEWWLTADLHAPIPQLPSPESSVKVEWRLPSDLAPTQPAKWVQTSGALPPEQRTQRHWPSLTPDRPESIFEERASAARPAPNPKGTLPKTVQQTLFNPANLIEKPIIDSQALAEVGVTDTTPAPSGGWDALGLIIVRFPGGSVLTTPRQLSIWNAGTASDNNLPRSILQSLQAAIRNGRDPSGRFRTVADWSDSLPFSDSWALQAQLGGDGPGWSTWQARSLDAKASMEVVSRENVSIVGWIVAALLAVLGMLLVGRLRRLGVFLLLGWLLLAATALQVLPPALSGLAVGPMLAGLVIAFVAVCRRPTRKLPDSRTELIAATTRKRLSAGLVGGAASAWFVALTVTAAAPDVATVYLLPGPANDPEPKTVLAPAEMLERLKQLANPKLALSEYAILQSHWNGQGLANGAEFESRLRVYLFAERARIELPLGESKLREALLDGAAAFPKSMGSGRFVLEVEGRGEHRIQLKFTAPIAGVGSDREVRFAIPESPITQLDFQLSSGSDQLQAVNYLGVQRTNKDGNELHADLGRSRLIHVRWRQPGVAAKTQARVQEAALWDLNQTAGTLYAAFDYRVGQGSLQALKINLPPNLEISRLEVRADSAVAQASPPRIRDWSVSAERVLSVELQSAMSGSFQLLLEGVATRPLSTRPPLLFPATIGVPDVDSYVAYRLRGLSSTLEVERRGVADYAADSFLRDIWRRANVEPLPTAVTRAFRRLRNETVYLRPTLAHTAPAVQGTQELTWRLGPRGAEVRAAAHWTASTELLTFVEWEAPASIVLNELLGANIHSSQRIGNRMQVWLREPAAEVALVWYGNLPRAGPAADVMIFDVPSIRQSGVRSAESVVRVRSPGGWALSAENLAGSGTPHSNNDEREIAWRSNNTALPARFVMRGHQADARIQSVTIAEVVERRLRCTVVLDLNLRRDRPHSLVVALQEAANWEAVVEEAPNMRVQKRTNRESVQWLIDLPASDTPRPPIVLVVSRAITGAHEVALPSLTISEGDRPVAANRWFAFVGPEIREQPSAELRKAAELAEVLLANRPREAVLLRDRGGRIWSDIAGNAQPKALVAALPLALLPGVRVGLLDVEVALSSQPSICRAAIDLLHESGATIDCQLPQGGTLVGWAIDGVELPLPSRKDRFAVPLLPDGGPRLLQMVWTVSEAVWEAPTLISGNERVRVDAELWSALAPAGERLDVASAESMALHNLKRADALVRFAADRDRIVWPDSTLQQMGARALRRSRLADTAMAGPRADVFTGERGPNGIALVDWSVRLREQAQSLRGKGPILSAASLRETTYDRLPFSREFQTGTPVRWSIAASQPPPEVRLRPVTASAPLSELASLGFIALAVAALGLLMLLLERSTRPEQAAVIALLGAAAFGPAEALPFIVLAALAVLVRVGWAGKRVYRWLGG